MLTLVYSLFFPILPGIRILLAYIRRAVINVCRINISERQANKQINKLVLAILVEAG